MAHLAQKIAEQYSKMLAVKCYIQMVTKISGNFPSKSYIVVLQIVSIENAEWNGSE